MGLGGISPCPPKPTLSHMGENVISQILTLNFSLGCSYPTETSEPPPELTIHNGEVCQNRRQSPRVVASVEVTVAGADLRRQNRPRETKAERQEKRPWKTSSEKVVPRSEVARQLAVGAEQRSTPQTASHSQPRHRWPKLGLQPAGTNRNTIHSTRLYTRLYTKQYTKVFNGSSVLFINQFNYTILHWGNSTVTELQITPFFRLWCEVLKPTIGFEENPLATWKPAFKKV